jgi:hypothetical protein
VGSGLLAKPKVFLELFKKQPKSDIFEKCTILDTKSRRRVLVRRATAEICIVAAALPQMRVGYIDGGNDAVAHRLDRIGVAVTDLRDVTLTACDTLVVGNLAMKFRTGLANVMPRIYD